MMNTDKPEWRGIRHYERQASRNDAIQSFSVIAFLVVLCCVAALLSGCASSSRNRDYANNCGYAMDQEGLCKSVIR
jgi:hypothetical protein